MPRLTTAPRSACATAAASSVAPTWMSTVAFVVVALLALGLGARLAAGAWQTGRAERFEQPAVRARLVYVYMHGCGWCEKFTPQWAAFEGKYAAKLRAVGVAVERLEQGEPAARELGVRSFPTVLLLVPADGRRVEFKGERTADGLASFLAENGFPLSA